MSLTPGSRLGVYDITAQIGVGGMGEVYRATDTNLKRQVAIKVLPASVAGDADRLARFQREAEVLAALNHPNIAAIYGLEKTADLTALVMELVEGDDLSQRIAKGAIPIDEALPIAKQIAEALEAAHEQGIIHRDLKPANIKVRADGTVKVLDFGLAKAMDPAAASSAEAMNSPTLSLHATQAGMILGTAAYMAPEQARGKAVDKRADIWAFGVVLCEMLTGRRVFDPSTGSGLLRAQPRGERDSVMDVLAAVINKDIDLAALPADTPASVRRLIARCLDRDLKRRLRDIGEARVILENPASPLVSDPPPVRTVADAPPPPARVLLWRRALPWTAAGILAVALAVAVWQWAPWRGASAPAGVSAVELTPLSFEQGGQTDAVWSPDGKAVAFGAREHDTEPYQLYVRYLDSPVATRITSTPTAVQSVVQWTTTGKIIFVENLRLWSVSPVGGEPEPWGGSEARQPANLVRFALPIVSKDGTSLAGFFRGVDGVLNIRTLSSGDSVGRPYEPAPFASRNVFNRPHVSLSPDGRQILLLRNAGEGEEAWLMPYPASAANPPRKILPGVLGFSGTPTASWMPDNRHLVLSGSSRASRPAQLYLADTVSSTLTVISSGTTAQHAPAVSPDGRQLAFLERVFDRDIVAVDLATAVVTPVNATQRSEEMPAWAARDSAMVYVTDRNGEMEIWLRKPGQPARPVVTPRDFPPGKTLGFMGPALSPDGTRVIYSWLGGGLATLWISAVAGGPPVSLVKNSRSDDTPGSWSPDGNWFVYRSLENGKLSLNKVKTTGGAEPVVLDATARGVSVPVWSPAGDWILYGLPRPKLISPDGKTTSALVVPAALVHAFSADGRTIYGIRQPAANGPGELFSISVAGGPEKIIGTLPRTFLPFASLNPGLRLSLTPDGKSLTFSTVKATSNLWLMDGLLSVTGR